MKLILIVKKSEKNGKTYRQLCCDLGYRVATLTFDDNLIAELLGYSVAYLYSLSCGELNVGQISINKS